MRIDLCSCCVKDVFRCMVGGAFEASCELLLLKFLILLQQLLMPFGLLAEMVHKVLILLLELRLLDLETWSR
jgi:hypothetical protein